MKKILIAGGNSGIGLEVARQLAALGHHLVLLGRDPQKGEAALAELQNQPGKAEFLRADLATHAGVREAATALLDVHDHFDILLHTTGVLIFDDARTADGLHPFFAVNYLSRYHLTQRLLPLLRKSESPAVIMMSSNISLDTKIDFTEYPLFNPFDFRQAGRPIQFSNHHYAVYLRDTEPRIRAAVVNAGLADTGIWREVQSTRTSVLKSNQMNTIPESAAVSVELCLSDGWESGSYWGTLGKMESVSLQLDAQETERLIAICRDLTGV